MNEEVEHGSKQDKQRKRLVIIGLLFFMLMTFTLLATAFYKLNELLHIGV